MKARLARQIFREYDIRGRFPEEFTEETSRRIGQAFGTILAREKLGKEQERAGRKNKRGAGSPAEGKGRRGGKG